MEASKPGPACWAVLPLALLLAAPAAAAERVDWRAWDGILAERVSPTRLHGVALAGVDYDGLRADRDAFDALVASLAGFDPDVLSSRAEKLAFWINAYNVGAVKLVLDHPEVGSLTAVGPEKGAVWKMDALEIGGRGYSLDAIEHGTLRKLAEPRIHFAVVCASVSCPDLRAEAYRAARLDAQLDQQTRRFLGNRDKGLRFDAADERVVVTRLFKWFAADFGGRQGVLDFIAAHLPAGREPPAGWRGFTLGYLGYDWRLNGT